MKKVTAAILVLNDRVLIAKRKKGSSLEYKWEFPGGKIKKGETPEECLKREMHKEFEIEVVVGDFFGESVYENDSGDLQLLAHWASWDSGELVARVHEEYRWVYVNELDNFDLAPADIVLAEKLKEIKNRQ